VIVVDAPEQAHQALTLLRERLGVSLKAVYLHGSAVSQGLHAHSDIDLLVVVNAPIANETLRELLQDLSAVSAPPGDSRLRPLEVIAFLLRELDLPAYPARAELVFGEWLREAFEAGCLPEGGADPEFTLMLAQARLEARPLFGPPAADLLPAITRQDIRRAIHDSLPILLAALAEDERNGLLTLARMWRTAKDGAFVSKARAAEWARLQLSRTASDALALAREEYLGARSVDWSNRSAEVQTAALELAQRIRATL